MSCIGVFIEAEAADFSYQAGFDLVMLMSFKNLSVS